MPAIPLAAPSHVRTMSFHIICSHLHCVCPSATAYTPWRILHLRGSSLQPHATASTAATQTTGRESTRSSIRQAHSVILHHPCTTTSHPCMPRCMRAMMDFRPPRPSMRITSDRNKRMLPGGRAALHHRWQCFPVTVNECSWGDSSHQALIARPSARRAWPGQHVPRRRMLWHRG
jgi:hypothetical protein